MERLSQEAIKSIEMTFVVYEVRGDSFLFPLYLGKVVRIATASEFAEDKVCDGRPAPLYYDEYCMKKEGKEMKFVVLRQDRFILVACAYRSQLDDVAHRVDNLVR